MARILIVCIGLLVSIACADDAAATPTAAERFLDAILRGDLALVKELAAAVTNKQVPNLLYQAPASPNPEVVELVKLLLQHGAKVDVAPTSPLGLSQRDDDWSI